MKTKQLGFTLIELIVVIVLLGIIGSVATARFQDLSTQAADAVAQGVAAELSSGSAINYAAFSTGVAGTTAIGTGGTVDCTADVGGLLQAGIPADITMADGADVTCGSIGDTVTCNVTHDSGTTTASATIICTAT